jgi:hypothetical protein
VKSALGIVSFCVAILGISAPTHAIVEVAFIEPGDYTDGAVRGGLFGSGGLGTVNAVRQHLAMLGDNNLSPREALRIEVLDIDLAGRYEWWRFPFDARIMRSSSVPAIEVRYIYYVDGKIVDEGEERITDMNYLQGTRTGKPGGPLKYEKRMLDRWFRDRFVNRRSEEK